MSLLLNHTLVTLLSYIKHRKCGVPFKKKMWSFRLRNQKVQFFRFYVRVKQNCESNQQMCLIMLVIQ